jgi:hypothetical protein
LGVDAGSQGFHFFSSTNTQSFVSPVSGVCHGGPTGGSKEE